METNEINDKLYEKLKGIECFMGTFPRDMLPSINKKPAAIILNSDDSKNEGTHWLAIFFNEDGYGEYFDSYGLPPLYSDIINYLNKYNPNGWVFNGVTLQSTFSDTCGHYCILFVMLRCKNISFKEIIKLFTNNNFINDKIIKDYIL